MPNPYFRFKQFTIFHDRCAMKVGTDGVLLGAWATIVGSNRVLDIGTGSGLIALMLAQRNINATVSAIDIDEGAINQAKDNIANSPFADRVRCCHAALQDYVNRTDDKYDLIVSNPPFFANSVKSPDQQRSTARHTDTLPINQLFRECSHLITNTGRLSVIYPYQYKDRILENAMQYKFYPIRITIVYPTCASKPKRLLLEFSKTELNPVIEDNLIIEEERHVYSEQFKNLVSEFYLNM